MVRVWSSWLHQYQHQHYAPQGKVPQEIQQAFKSSLEGNLLISWYDSFLFCTFLEFKDIKIFNIFDLLKSLIPIKVNSKKGLFVILLYPEKQDNDED